VCSCRNRLDELTGPSPCATGRHARVPDIQSLRPASCSSRRVGSTAGNPAQAAAASPEGRPAGRITEGNRRGPTAAAGGAPRRSASSAEGDASVGTGDKAGAAESRSGSSASRWGVRADYCHCSERRAAARSADDRIRHDPGSRSRSEARRCGSRCFRQHGWSRQSAAWHPTRDSSSNLCRIQPGRITGPNAAPGPKRRSRRGIRRRGRSAQTGGGTPTGSDRRAG